MRCPECGKECSKGIIEASGGSFTQLNTKVIWYPKEQKGKMIRKGVVNLSLYGEGYYCDECMKVFASFQER